MALISALACSAPPARGIMRIGTSTRGVSDVSSASQTKAPNATSATTPSA